jgi:hypothetical protein
MPKINSILGPISGKLNDKVFVKGKKANFMRDVPATGSKKDETELKKRYKAASLLNSFASELNQVVKIYCGALKPSGFYQTILGRFLKDASKLRVQQLLQLKDLEIHPRHTLAKLGKCETIVKTIKNKIVVTIDTKAHPWKGKKNADSYYYEVLLLTWTKNKKSTITHDCQLSDWIAIDGGLPEFEFEFPKSATTVHWLLCVGQRLGIRETEIGFLETRGMRIIDAGTFDQREQAMLRKMEKEISLKKDISKRAPVEQKVRVRAKRVKVK